MSMGEIPQPTENDPKLEAQRKSPILRAFLSDNSEVVKWHSEGYEAMKSALEMFDESFGEGWGVVLGDTIVGYAKLDGVFPNENANETVDAYMRLMTMQMVFISWELSDKQELIKCVFPDLIVQVATTPYVSKRVANITTSQVTKYINASLNAGIYLKTEHDKAIAAKEKFAKKKITSDPEQVFRGTIPHEITDAFNDRESWPIYDDDNDFQSA